MKHISKITIAFFIFLFAETSTAQVFQKATNDAFIVTKMADKFHIQPKPVNASFSNDVYFLLLKTLDEDKICFTQDDIKQFENYKNNIHNDIINRKTTFLELITNLYSQRLHQIDTMLLSISKTKFNLNSNEIYTAKEDTTYPQNTSLQKLKLSKLIKLEINNSIAEAFEISSFSSIPKQRQDSIEIILRDEITKNFVRSVQKKLQYPGGIQQYVADEYCSSIALSFDPHTEYFTATSRENFESEVGKKSLVFGFNLKENANGEVIIGNLLPGSPAFKSGMISKGDKITSIQWEGSNAIDVGNASIQEISQILSTSNHAKATITFTKADGTKREVTLGKELATNDIDDDKVSSFILKGEKNIGYISLPSFYEDWEHENSINGCSNDVAKEILKLKKENIEGLIIDLRFNGGGSVQEAVDLAGLFIDAGPIAQEKTRDPKVFTIKDLSRGTIYDGPLTILVNGFSASASELLAGALQDYNRALIIGSPTFGKATGQRVLPLDTSIVLNNVDATKITGNSVKLTLLQIYQVSGKTAQFKGVIPDILLPDATEAYDRKEQNEYFAIPATNIAANKYYLPLNPLPVGALKEKANEYFKADNYFERLNKFILQKKLSSQKKDLSLKLDDLLKQKSLDKKEDDFEEEENSASSKSAKIFSVNNNSFNEAKINANVELKDLMESFKKRLSKDSYVNIAYKLLLLMNK